jgi:hypothetical protein
LRSPVHELRSHCHEQQQGLSVSPLYSATTPLSAPCRARKHTQTTTISCSKAHANTDGRCIDIDRLIYHTHPHKAQKVGATPRVAAAQGRVQAATHAPRPIVIARAGMIGGALQPASKTGGYRGAVGVKTADSCLVNSEHGASVETRFTHRFTSALMRHSRSSNLVEALTLHGGDDARSSSCARRSESRSSWLCRPLD